MFSQPIVFVIGAGASTEYGLPSGAQMKRRIAHVLSPNRKPSGLPVGDIQVFFMLGYREPGNRQNDATELAAKVLEFESIDEALHWFSAQPKIVAIGKAAIVWEILQSERNSSLFNPGNITAIPERDYTNTWLPHFLSMLVSSLRREQTQELFRNVTLINFNYDRTIEHFLYSRLQTNFGYTATEAIDAVSTLKMIRPYGSIGTLPWQARGGIPFGEAIGIDREKLFLLSENVRTYTEQNVS